jgi:hypothetical protein
MGRCGVTRRLPLCEDRRHAPPLNWEPALEPEPQYTYPYASQGQRPRHVNVRPVVPEHDRRLSPLRSGDLT